MGTNKTSLALLVALALLAALAAGCGSDDRTSASGNATDAAFITDMTAHHQSAIEMAVVAQTRAERAEVRTLADEIISAQKGEISVMKRISDDMRAMGMHDGGSMGMSQSELGMNMDLPLLRRAEPFDRAFIDMMVPHHQGAIAMARKQLAHGNQPALRKRTMEAPMRAAPTRAGPTPASARRRSAPREEAAWKYPSVPGMNAAAQPAPSAAAASPARPPPSAREVRQHARGGNHEHRRHGDQQHQRGRRSQLLAGKRRSPGHATSQRPSRSS